MPVEELVGLLYVSWVFAAISFAGAVLYVLWRISDWVIAVVHVYTVCVAGVITVPPSFGVVLVPVS